MSELSRKLPTIYSSGPGYDAAMEIEKLERELAAGKARVRELEAVSMRRHDISRQLRELFVTLKPYQDYVVLLEAANVLDS